MTGDEDHYSSVRSTRSGSRSGNMSAGSRREQRYKTELCHQFEESGSCRYGPRCQFAHGRADLRTVMHHPRYKTDLCRTFHTTGLCPYGKRCHFIHNDDDWRKSTDTVQNHRLEVFPPPSSTLFNIDSTSEWSLLGLVVLVPALSPDLAITIAPATIKSSSRLLRRTAADVEELVDGSSSCCSVASSSRSASRSPSFCDVFNWTLVE